MDYHLFFDGLIGNNILNKINAIIDYKQRLLTTRNANIKFYLNKTEEDYARNIEVNNLETVLARSEELTDEELRIDQDLNKEEKTKLRTIINKFKDIFYHENEHLTFTSIIKHQIHTVNELPVYTKSYRYPQIHEEEVSKQISEMLNQNIIRPSASPYNSPLWVVPKKADSLGNKKWRLVIDFRKLNDVTVSDRFPMPKIEDILYGKLGRANYFSTIDCAKGFYQIEMHPDDIKKTAFSTADNHYEFLRMPFGLKNAPATFQRMINSVLSGLIGKICLVYMDDIIVFSTSIEEHIDALNRVFLRLKEANLKVQLSKCNFMAKQTEYLGHVVTPNGVKTNPKTVRAIQEFPIPKTVKEIRSFLGISGYYRKFIRDYSRIAHPMVKCLQKDAKIDYQNCAYVEAFNKLKAILLHDPILTQANFNKKFTLTTDASNYALGAVLSQDNRPIAYASRSLNKHERNYSTIEKELLAIVWATKYFRPYIFGRKFVVRTDHKPLVWLNGLKEPNSKLQRWKIRLNEYDFDVEYIKGRENVVADGLSRIPTIVKSLHRVDNNADVDAISEDGDLQTHSNQIIVTADVHVNANEICEEADIITAVENISLQNNITEDDLETIHSADSDINNFIHISERPINLFKNQLILTTENNRTETVQIIFKKHRTTVPITGNTNILQLMKDKLPSKGLIAIYINDDSLFLKLQDIYREYFSRNRGLKLLRCTRILKDVVDREELLKCIEHTHLQNNHRGINEVFFELKDSIYHPNLQKEIHRYINNCDVCNLAKFDRQPIRHSLSITETPRTINEIVHFDIWYPQRGTMYLTSIDKLSKYATAYKLKDRSWITIIAAIQDRIRNLGKPKLFVTDSELDVLTIKQFLKENNIQLHFTTTYNKTGNADVERLHQTLNEHIRLFNSDPSNTDDLETKVHNAIVHYNNTIHTVHRNRPINFINNVMTKDDLKEIAHEMHAKKIERINKYNKQTINNTNNNNSTNNNNFVRNYRMSKSHPRYKKVSNYREENNYLIPNDSKNKKYYKTQIKRKYKYQQ